MEELTVWHWLLIWTGGWAIISIFIIFTDCINKEGPHLDRVISNCKIGRYYDRRNIQIETSLVS